MKLMENVPCEDLPQVDAGLVKYGAFKTMRQQLRKIPPPPSLGMKPTAQTKPAKVSFRGDEIAEGVENWCA